MFSDIYTIKYNDWCIEVDFDAYILGAYSYFKENKRRLYIGEYTEGILIAIGEHGILVDYNTKTSDTRLSEFYNQISHKE